MNEPTINLYSDTQTRPGAEMRRAMAEAEVGDEQHGLDPTVNRLCASVAELLGKEAAMFLPSGTMCNEIAIAVHCRGGDEIYAHESSHIINFEGGGPSALAGASLFPLDGERGMYSAQTLAAAIRAPNNRYAPRPRLVVVEQTANMGGGSVWPLEQVISVAAQASERGLALHMDGARLLNAVVASGVEAAALCAPFDSCWIDLSKGLGCPMGGVLAGSREFIDAAWWWKQRMGGAFARPASSPRPGCTRSRTTLVDSPTTTTTRGASPTSWQAPTVSRCFTLRSRPTSYSWTSLPAATARRP